MFWTGLSESKTLNDLNLVIVLLKPMFSGMTGRLYTRLLYSDLCLEVAFWPITILTLWFHHQQNSVFCFKLTHILFEESAQVSRASLWLQLNIVQPKNTVSKPEGGAEGGTDTRSLWLFNTDQVVHHELIPWTEAVSILRHNSPKCKLKEHFFFTLEEIQGPSQRHKVQSDITGLPLRDLKMTTAWKQSKGTQKDDTEEEFSQI